MSETFLGGKTSDLPLQYAERVKFRKFLFESGYSFLDTLRGRSLYGFINRNYEVIAPTPDIKVFGDYSAETQGLTFVVNQFNKFRDYYLQKAEEGNYTVPTLITGLIPKVSFIDYEESYEAYLEGFKSIILEKLVTSRQAPGMSFENFLFTFQDIIFDVELENRPVTKSGFMLSLESSVYNTGIYVDLGPGISAELDQQKADFINDDGFKCFMEMSNKFGFYVDGNYPWRLAVNLGSDFTRTLLMNGRPQTQFENFYSDTFTMKVGRDDYWAIVKLTKELYVSYNQLVGINTLSNFANRIDDKVWIETLLMCKFKELGLMRTNIQTDLFGRVFNKSIDISRRFGLSSISGTIGFINSFCAEQLKNKILGQP